MRIGVLGGTGSAGAASVAALAARGHEVRVLSRRAPDRPVPGTRHLAVDVLSGAGLDTALAGLDALLDAVGGDPRHPEPVLVDGVRRVLDAARRHDVGHVLCLSIVGADRVGLRYYRAKVAQEQVVADSGLAWSVLRATQFHSLLAGIFAAGARRRVLPAPRVPLQPVDVREVGAALADAIEGPASRSVASFAGPEIVPVSELARRWRTATHARALPIRVPVVGSALRSVAAGALCDPAAPRGAVSFGAWLDRRRSG